MELGNQERLHFFTEKPVEIDDIEKKYGINLQEHRVFDYEKGKKTIRFFDIAKEINKPYFEGGGRPRRGEISLNYNFCVENNLKIGDYYEISGRKFRIASYVYLPNYIYVIKSDQDLLPDHKNFGIGVMNLEDMKEIGPYRPITTIRQKEVRKTSKNFRWK